MSDDSVNVSVAVQREEAPYGASHGRSNFAGVVAVIGVLYAAYFEFRYNGLWIENDTSVFTGTTTAMLRAGSVFFPGQYSHGFGYPAWLGVLSLDTGLSPAVVNGLVAPFFGMTFALLTAYLLYRRLLRSEVATAVAAMLLFLIPDLMFTLLRGNHEKLNVPFIMLAVYSLLWFVDARRRRDFRSMFVSTVLYYVCVFMNGITNDYFGVFLAIALFSAAPLLVFFERMRWTRESLRDHVRRFTVTAVVSAIIMVWVMVFLFPQTNSTVGLVTALLVRLQHLFTTQQATDNPYVTASQQWVTPLVNAIFSSFNWGLVVLSSLALVYMLVLSKPIKRVVVNSEELVLAAMYLSLLGLVFAAVPVDLVGLSAGTNLELRNYTYYALFASPVIVIAMGIVRSRLRLGLHGQASSFVLALVYGALFLIAVPKGTVDPLYSNQWLGYTADEKQALVVFGEHTRSTALWAGANNRLPELYATLFPGLTARDMVVGYSARRSPYATDIMMSPMIRGSTIAERISLPGVDGMNRLFDDGGAQIYVPQLRGPFQY